MCEHSATSLLHRSGLRWHTVHIGTVANGPLGKTLGDFIRQVAGVKST
jgi:hypothetical protein